MRKRSAEIAGVAAIGVLFAAFTWRSWLAWGDLDLDYGREMYVPLRLTRGAILYRDVRYPYGPLSPYLHALLYRLWKPHLDVLYASGLTATAATVMALFSIARRLSTPLGATLAATLAMVDLMFIPGAPGFSYVFPYAYPTLHGCLFVVLEVALAFSLLDRARTRTAVLTGATIGLAILAKPEFAVVAIVIGLLTTAAMWLRGFRSARTITAMWMPAVGLPVLGYGALSVWVSPSIIVTRGLFAPEYFQSSKIIGYMIAGLPVGADFGEGARFVASFYLRCVGVLAVAISGIVVAGRVDRVAYRRLPSRQSRWIGPVVSVLVAFILIGAAHQIATSAPGPRPSTILSLRYGALPPVLAAFVLWRIAALWSQRRSSGQCEASTLREALLGVAALLMFARVPANPVPGAYPNFYLPLAVIFLVHCLVDVLPRTLTSVPERRTSYSFSAMALVIVLIVTIGLERNTMWSGRRVELTTVRGTMMLDPSNPWLSVYRQAMGMIASQTEAGDSILAIPREVPLYFLTHRDNRLYETSPVATVVTPEAERAYVADLERERPVLILVSNRVQPEYGLGTFGSNYNQLIFDWIRSNYELESLIEEPTGTAQIGVWRVRTPGDAPEVRESSSTTGSADQVTRRAQKLAQVGRPARRRLVDARHVELLVRVRDQVPASVRLRETRREGTIQIAGRGEPLESVAVRGRRTEGCAARRGRSPDR